ncbi:MAG: ergothioneine biosynthesis protein EgtC [Synechococcales bacterium]|nr:ergothioneine biosynthesis protein EgtC [Synechococcales bacterium]
MCRLLGYLGPPVSLERLLYAPEHSLIVQSYQPREMTAGLLNADGFGIGWYAPESDSQPPFVYRNVLPIWNDMNLPELSRYVVSGQVVASVRSATLGLAVDFANCPPFRRDRLLMVHNGFIQNFRKTLYRPLRDRLSDALYESIQGTTDSEHLFAVLLNQLAQNPHLPVEQALAQTLALVFDLAQTHAVSVGANCVVSTGDRLVASRAAHQTAVPTLYWSRNSVNFPGAVVIASEPLFAGEWHLCPEQSILAVDSTLDVQIQPLPLI